MHLGGKRMPSTDKGTRVQRVSDCPPRFMSIRIVVFLQVLHPLLLQNVYVTRRPPNSVFMFRSGPSLSLRHCLSLEAAAAAVGVPLLTLCNVR
ncbi:hypothetical protein PoB_006857800 [Plakobranchus ocellatus]|uniref:Uncharacterized protein n=1 Tax=Plakobranchus ocellatus TaxID=259542 RepID=A0AAV4DCV8_9GAST|nr:hypothetical protein PoB_006857800 [Plakobranchus ocellatus]